MKSIWSGEEYSKSQLIEMQLFGTKMFFTDSEKYKVIGFISQNEMNYRSNKSSFYCSIVLSLLFGYFNHYFEMFLMFYYGGLRYLPLLDYDFLNFLTIKNYLKLEPIVKVCVPLVIGITLILEYV